MLTEIFYFGWTIPCNLHWLRLKKVYKAKFTCMKSVTPWMKVGTPGIVTVIEGPWPPAATAPPSRDPNNCSRFPPKGFSWGGGGADPGCGVLVLVLLDCVGPEPLVAVVVVDGVLVEADVEKVNVCEEDVVFWLAMDTKNSETYYTMS